MEHHVGRLIDHVHLRAADLAASRRFYRAVLEALGRGDSIQESDDHFNADELWIDKADGPVSRVHKPGERSYHPGYYAAFAFDPDGNNVEAVFHGPAKRSAASVVITA